MIPYHDENATERTAVVTLVLIGACVAMWVLAQGAGTDPALAASVCNLGLIPGELTLRAAVGDGFRMTDTLVCLTDPGRQISNVFSSMFLHGSWMHLIGNMWFLWLFGNNIEDSMSRAGYLVFYLVCGIAAAAFQVAADPASIIPMVGASGAISGVMGGYLVLFPRVRVYTLIPLGFYITTMALPAWAMLIYWMVIQLLGGFSSIVGGGEGGGVAFWAHVGGFVAGVVLVKMFARGDRLQQHRTHHWEPARRGNRW